MLEIGTIINGTMRDEEVIPELIAAGLSLRDELSPADREELEEIQGRAEAEDFNEYDCETAFDILQNYAPPYCYVGAHEGDGADYGVWISWDSVEDAVAQGEIIREDNKDRPLYMLEVNDHGNATLRKLDDHSEVWAVV